MSRAATVGFVAGSLEITATYPLEMAKTALQLQQPASKLHAAAPAHLASTPAVLRHALREYGVLGLYRGSAAWLVFAGPRSAVRFASFETLSAAASARGVHGSAADTVCGFAAGVAEAALCQTPSQAIAIKMVHDQAPGGANRYRGFLHAVRCIYAEDGFIRGFYCGLTPAVAKGATTNMIRFFGYGVCTRAMRRGQESTRPLAPWETMAAGGVAGAVSAILTQPIDTVKANMMGLEAAHFNRVGTLGCARELVRAGGWRALFKGVGPRAVRVFLEVGLQFTLFESVGRQLDRLLGPSAR